MTTKVFEELCHAVKAKPRPGEDYAAFAYRVADKVNALSSEAWDALSDEAQRWTNLVLSARDAHTRALKAAESAGEPAPELAAVEYKLDGDTFTGLPELPGFASVAAPPAKEEDAGEEEEARDEVTEAPAEGGGEAGAPAEAPPKAKARKRSSAARSKAAPAAKSPSTAAPAKAPAAPKPASKPASKAAPKPKPAAPAKRPSKPPGRPVAVADTAKIKVLVEGNPHRKGTKNYAVFAKYADGMTVAAALKKGIPRSNIRYECREKNIKVVSA